MKKRNLNRTRVRLYTLEIWFESAPELDSMPKYKMSRNNSLIKPTQEEEAELQRLNEELQRMEEEVDHILMQVNEQRNRAPELIQDIFSLTKEAKIMEIENQEPVPKTVQKFDEIKTKIESYADSHKLDSERRRILGNVLKLKKAVEENNDYAELLSSGLTGSNPIVTLPQARHLARLGDLFSVSFS